MDENEKAALLADADRMDRVGNPGRAAELRAAAEKRGAKADSTDEAPKGRRAARGETAAAE